MPHTHTHTLFTRMLENRKKNTFIRSCDYVSSVFFEIFRCLDFLTLDTTEIGSQLPQ